MTSFENNSENNFWQEIQREISETAEAKPTNLNMGKGASASSSQNSIAQNAEAENLKENSSARLFGGANQAPQANQGAYDFTLDRPNRNLSYSPSEQDNILSILKNNLGYYVVCDFLIGTERIETREGILYQSGVNFLTLYNPQYDTYTVCDIYSLKFITFYNTTTVPPERLGTRSSSKSGASAKSAGRRFY